MLSSRRSQRGRGRAPLERLAAPYGLGVRELLTRNLDIPGLVLPDNLGYDPPPTMLAALAERTGVTVARMRTMTPAGWVPWLLDDLGATVDLREHWKAPKGLASFTSGGAGTGSVVRHGE